MSLHEIRRPWVIGAVAVLLLVPSAELLLSIRQESQTFDESAHLFAGLSYWKRSDFGVNPEHPPLVKLVAALPLLPLRLEVPPAPNMFFRGASARGGTAFLYSHDADSLLFRARAGAAIFTLLLALLIFTASLEMYGVGAALFALAVFTFEPNILAHGALVTTDLGAGCCMFGAVYMFYRYVKQPSVFRLVVCGVISGLALAAKHSALVILPILAILAATEVILDRRNGRGRQAIRMLAALTLITLISSTVLWGFYGFRYAARPGGQQMIPPTPVFLQTLQHPAEAAVIGFFEQHHLLPEAYLYGLTDIVNASQEGRPAYLLGRLYPEGRWFYFPTAFLIKSTVGFVALLGLLLAAQAIWGAAHRRETLFVAIPALLFFSTAMSSKLDIGLRHVLPVYPFLIVLAAAGAWSLSSQSRRWAAVAILLLVFHAGSSVMAFPNYLPYSNEFWGGLSNTHKYLSDSNVGWAGGLKAMRAYIGQQHIEQCWFAYDGPVDPSYYAIPCSPLPTLFANIFGRPVQAVPEQIHGPVFISAQAMTGFDWGPAEMNVYSDFTTIRPAHVLQGEILVFNGTFDVPRISALSHYLMANRLWNTGRSDAALTEAKAAAALHPNFRPVHELLASIYARQNQKEQAIREYETAQNIYQTIQPEFQKLRPPPANPIAR
jgi:4-amino-4-deoxy-L-arabinose transferase-like glycosyltransferase